MGKKAVREEVRWQIVAHLNEGVKNNKEIAQLLGVSDKCVRTTKKNQEAIRQEWLAVGKVKFFINYQLSVLYY